MQELREGQILATRSWHRLVIRDRAQTSSNPAIEDDARSAFSEKAGNAAAPFTTPSQRPIFCPNGTILAIWARSSSRLSDTPRLS